MNNSTSSFGRPRIGDRVRKRYNLALSPELKRQAQDEAKNSGRSFSMWVEEAARDRLRFETTDFSRLVLHGTGNVQLPQFNYEGKVEFDFRCRQGSLLSFIEPAKFGASDSLGPVVGDLQLGGRSCRIECDSMLALSGINGKPELTPSHNSEVVLRFSPVSESSRYVVFFSNLQGGVVGPASKVNDVEIEVESISVPLETTSISRRRKQDTSVTAKCLISFPEPPDRFLECWARPLAKFFQAYAGRPVDVVAWGRVDDTGDLLELHLTPEKALPLHKGPCYANSNFPVVQWQAFLEDGFEEYIRIYESRQLAAFSQYLAMSRGRSITVNGRSSLLLPAVEFIANALGAKFNLEFKQGTSLGAKVNAIARAANLQISKAKRRTLNEIVRAQLRNPLLHEGLPDSEIGTLDNAKINDFLESFAISFHSLLIGINATHRYMIWDQESFMTPAEWLESDSTLS